MILHYVQHVPFEGAASIAGWAEKRGHSLSRSRLYLGDPLPEPEAFDWLIVMGGPMGTCDEAEYPWLKAEKLAIRKAVDAGRVVIGICLGAQLIAESLGARVFPNAHREIGWFPVKTTPAARELFEDLPEEMEVFHWHGDTFDLPGGATHLAESAGCRNQAFAVGKRVFGFQFHLETTEESARALMENCGHEITEGPYMQPAGEIMADAGRFAAINRRMESMLDRIAKSGR